MKMRRNKKLNRKGFTLIELLAVIVILAVIMVIASTSVLSSMNSSKKSSLADSAKSAKSSFDNKYTEMALVASEKILGLSTDTVINGTKTALTNVDKAALNINDTDYDLGKSFVYFDKTNSTFLVCFVAKDTGSFYVASAAKTEETTINGAPTDTKLTGMWACSNGQNSWTTSGTTSGTVTP